jgi:hypothetical protein
MPRTTSSLTRSGCVSAYANASADPHDPPNTCQRSTPARSRSCSMSATRCHVVFVLRSTSAELACGVLRPQLRWSNSVMR